MSIDLNEFKQEVHALAVEKRFYDPEPSDAELIAAIHSEISEALESWRNNEPPVWYRCNMEPDKSQSCGGENCGYACMSASGSHWDAEERDCAARKRKPEGFAAELIDVVLRLLDAAAAWGEALYVYAPTDIIWDAYTNREIKSLSLPELVTFLHRIVAEIDINRANGEDLSDANGMGYPISLVFAWLRAQGIGPEALMREKHEYNKTRPYRHGGKRA